MARHNPWNINRSRRASVRDAHLLTRYLRGESVATIARDEELAYSTVYAAVNRAIEAMRPHADYDRYRAVQLAELDVSRKLLRKVILGWETGNSTLQESLSCIDRLLKLQEREAKLLGLDRVPTPFDEISGMTDEQLESLVSEWAVELRSDI